MTALTLEDSPDADRFVINLSRHENGILSVNSIEIATGDMRNRYSFRGGKALLDVFREDIADHIKTAIAKLCDNDRLLSLPDFKFSIPGLVLSGMRILSTQRDDGAEALMVRFKYYVGAIKQLFKFEPSMSISSATVRERIAVDVLHDIVSPIFDMLALSQSSSRGLLADHAQSVGRRLDRLDLQMEELKFYSGLLQRYVAGCQQDAAEGRLESEIKDPQASLPRQREAERGSEPEPDRGNNEHMN